MYAHVCTLHSRYELGLDVVIILLGAGRARLESGMGLLPVAKTDHAKLFRTIMSAFRITSAGFVPLCPQTYHVRHIAPTNPDNFMLINIINITRVNVMLCILLAMCCLYSS